MKKAVLLIAFNRLDCVKKTFAAIRQAKPPRLYLAVDGPRPNEPGEKEQVEAVQKYLISHVDWPCKVKTRFLSVNSGGCGYGVSGAVTWLFENEPDGIILEDDCVAAPSFFTYCEELLDKYKDDKRIWHIAGDAPIETNIPETYYFSKIQHCWGWASWADRWKFFDFDITFFPQKKFKNFSHHKKVIQYWKKIYKGLRENEIDSWAYRWTFKIVENNGFCITPSHPLISNVGIDGVHYSNSLNDARLNKRTVEIKKIMHPKKIAFNEPLVDRIYKEVFGIKENKILKVKTKENHIKIYLFGIKILSYSKKGTT